MSVSGFNVHVEGDAIAHRRHLQMLQSGMLSESYPRLHGLRDERIGRAMPSLILRELHG
jgi:hypothetical protein